MKILSIKNIRKKYHTKKEEILAVDNFSFNIEKGDFISIIGPSGCGKSTILSILAGLINYEGEIINNGYKIGYMLQEDSLFPFRTIYKNSILGLEIKNELTIENKKYTLDLLKKYGLENFIDSYPSSLSGGMKKRVALIRTLAIKPDILLLDEPFSALDHVTRLKVSSDVHNIIKKENKTAIMVTHNLEEAILLSNKIIVLSKRPSTIKNIYNINSPIDRSDPEFSYYYNLIWKDIDHDV